MAARVYLHVGTMKAATTYLQTLFDENVDILADAGWLWPGSSTNRRAAGDLLGPPDRFPGDEGAWARMAKTVRRFDGDVLISMELLAPLRPAGLKRLARSLGDAEKHVIITARELTRVIPSQWQEGMQDRRPASWTQYVEQICTNEPTTPQARYFWKAQDLARIIRAWSAVAPRERISLVTVPPPGGDPATVWRRFASVLGLDADQFRQPEPRNESLGVVSAELMRRLNAELTDLEYPVYRRGFRLTLAKQVLATRAKTEPKVTLPPDQHAWVRARAERMLGEVEELGVAVVGDLKELMPPAEPPDGWVDPTEIRTDDLLAVATDGLLGLGTRFGELHVEHQRLGEDHAQLAQDRDEAVQQRDRAMRDRDRAIRERDRALEELAAAASLRERVRRRARRNRYARWLVHRLRAARAAVRR